MAAAPTATSPDKHFVRTAALAASRSGNSRHVCELGWFKVRCCKKPEASQSDAAGAAVPKKVRLVARRADPPKRTPLWTSVSPCPLRFTKIFRSSRRAYDAIST